jgi:SAM-dependent methyltransferase
VRTAAENARERVRRRHQRTLFGRVPELYDACRPGYPGDLVEFAVTTSRLGASSAVLEVGCGTGQLTQSLAGYGFSLTAIDISPSMIAVARRRLGTPAIAFRASSFEDLDMTDASFDLMVSAAAFHWVDPEVRFRKAARLLRPGGWLALLGTGERYDEPLGSALLEMWVARSDDGGAWASQRKLSDAETIAASGLFEDPVSRTDQRRLRLAAEVVVGVESTRATSLSWADAERLAFADELRGRLRSLAEIWLTRATSLTMARLRTPELS